MKEVSKRLVAKRPKNFPREVKTISDDQLQQLIKYSNSTQKLWSEYLGLYTDLFSNEGDVERKAKTHALAVMCVNLRFNYGCTFHRIYSAVLKAKSNSDLELSSQILRLDNKWDFIDSLFEI